VEKFQRNLAHNIQHVRKQGQRSKVSVTTVRPNALWRRKLTFLRASTRGSTVFQEKSSWWSRKVTMRSECCKKVKTLANLATSLEVGQI